MDHRRTRASSPVPNSEAFGMAAFEATFRRRGFTGQRSWAAEPWPLQLHPESGDRRLLLIPKSGWLLRLLPREKGGWMTEYQWDSRFRPDETLFRRGLETLKLWESFSVLPIRQLSLGDCFNDAGKNAK